MTLELFLSIAGFMAVLIGGAYALVRVIVKQFETRLDERFSAMEVSRQEARTQWNERFSKFEEQQRTLERDILTLRAEMPREYVRREDAIRSETVFTAKLDALAAKLDGFIARHA